MLESVARNVFLTEPTASTMRIFFVMALILLVSCKDQTIKNELTGTWNYDFEATRTEMETRGATQSEINFMESLFRSLGQAQISFLDNGDLNFQMTDLSQKGTWELRDKGSTLAMDLTGSEQISAIDYLGGDTLILVPLNEEELSFPRVLTQQKDASE